eukprot:129211-Chlamydomonas_euryale.AAC.1
MFASSGVERDIMLWQVWGVCVVGEAVCCGRCGACVGEGEGHHAVAGASLVCWGALPPPTSGPFRTTRAAISPPPSLDPTCQPPPAHTCPLHPTAAPFRATRAAASASCRATPRA